MNPKTIACIAGAFLLAGAATLAAQTEIPGTVTTVDDRDVTIRVPGPLLPRVGDPVRLRFRDPVPGAGLIFVEGEWEVTAVRRGEVDAQPRGETAVPQPGLVALIASTDPQPRDAVPETPEDEAAGNEPAGDERVADPAGDEPVAANVRERPEPRIERRRWVWLSWGVEGMGVRNPLFGAYEPDPALGVGMSATLGVFVRPGLVVHGYLGAVRASGLDPALDDSETVGELTRGLGVTYLLGRAGNVPGDIHLFVQAGLAWYDVHYGDFDDETEATGSGVFAGAGILYTIHPSFGLYAAGQLFTASYDGVFDPAFDRAPARLAVGLAAIL